MTVVLDSWAVLRLLEGNSTAGEAVAELLAGERPIMSWINLGEVFYVLRRATTDTQAENTVRDVCDVVTAELPDVPLVLSAGRIKADYPLAHADAFAAATALAHSARLWTGDPELLRPEAPWQWRDLR